MKKTLAFFTLLLGLISMFAQSGPTFPYQAVVRNSQNQLIKDSTFAVDVAIYQGATLKYSETQRVTTNANGQFTMNIGGGTVVDGALTDVADWSVAKFKITYHLSGGDIVSENAVSPVPYALQAANATSGNFLTSDSAVITTMQSDIAALQAASLDCNDVRNCIADTLNAYTPTTQLCNAVKDCDFSGNTSIANLLQTLSDQIAAQNRVVDSLAHIVDSLSNLTPSSPGGGDNTCCSELGARLDSLAHIVDSLSNLTPVNPVTPTDTFDCGTDKVRDVDGNEYNTVQIGNQCWMKENLRTITIGTRYPGGDTNNVATYGLLYDWAAVMQGASSTNYPTDGKKVRGICPEGWHVPSDVEWDILTNYVKSKSEYICGESEDNIAKALSSTTGWTINTTNNCVVGNSPENNNETGFSAFPAGGYYGNTGPSNFSIGAYMWSSTQKSDGYAWYRLLGYAKTSVVYSSGHKSTYYSVRCLRDADNGDAPGEVSCEQVMECMADTLSRLNARITSQGETIAAQGAEIETLNGTVTTQGETITAQGNTITAQGNTIDSLSHVVDSLSNLPHGGGDTPTAFTCGTSKVKDVDNNEYNTVKIGNQCWMKENLRTKIGGDGDKGYPTGAGNDTVTYGRLYTWTAMMNGAGTTNYPVSGDKVRGICPEGWHVPSDAEWTTMTDYVKSQSEYVCPGCSGTDDEIMTFCIAKALSSTTGWNSDETTCNVGNAPEGNNLTGFAAVPAGCCFGGDFDVFGYNAYFWSATQYDNSTAWYRYLASVNFIVGRLPVNKEFGFSVRCLRDAGIGGGDEPSEPDTPVTPTDTFNCGTSKVKDVDNNEYNTVKIGSQCWMAQNLRTTTRQYGNVWTNSDVDSAIYGRYYDWQAAMQIDVANNQTYSGSDVKHQGICPTGWHVPSDAEWDTLTHYVFNSTSPDYKCGSSCGSWSAQSDVSCIAKALSSTTGWNSNTSEGCNAGNTGDKANATGFAAVPAGGCLNGNSSNFGDHASFWSATQNVANNAWSRTLHGSDSLVRRSRGGKGLGFSVRCLRDAGIGGGDEPSEPDTPVTPTDTFDCGTDKVKDVQNNEYNTVKIGNQCWTKENLRTNVGTGDYGYPTGVSGTADTVTYGRLYSWAAVMNGASASSDVPSGVPGICPEGWHVPSDGEWGNLINYVKSKPNEYKCGDDANNIANALSSETGWTNSSTSGCNAGDDSETRNKTGFSAVPAGYFDTNSTNKGTHAYFWSTTDSGSAVYYRYLDNTSSSMNSGFEFSENMGLSVRCLRN